MIIDDALNFFQEQGCVIVATIDNNGYPHTSCKALVTVDKNKVYLFDVYHGKTFDNLKNNPRLSITLIDEHKYKGYCLKGQAEIIEIDKIDPNIITAWEEKLATRITSRIIKNIQGIKGHPEHPEAKLPKPKYMIMMIVEHAVNLAPQH